MLDVGERIKQKRYTSGPIVPMGNIEIKGSPEYYEKWDWWGHDRTCKEKIRSEAIDTILDQNKKEE